MLPPTLTPAWPPAQVEVRPGHEAAGPMSSTEVAGMKAREHGLRVSSAAGLGQAV